VENWLATIPQFHTNILTLALGSGVTGLHPSKRMGKWDISFSSIFSPLRQLGLPILTNISDIWVPNVQDHNSDADAFFNRNPKHPFASARWRYA
jgi:hypothetical protein